MRYFFALGVLFLATATSVRASAPVRPVVSATQLGSVVESVTVDTHGSLDPKVASRYLTILPGATLSQSAIDRDYQNLTHIAGYKATLSITDGDKASSVRLHWDVTEKTLAPTYHPYYSDRPLTAPFQGVGFIVTSRPLTENGTNLTAYTQLARRANLFSSFFTVPLKVDAQKSIERDLVIAYSGGKGVYRQLIPPNKNIYSWSDSYQFDYWQHNANDTQFEAGFRYVKSSTQLPSGLVSPFFYPTWRAPAHNAILTAGLLHGCVDNAARWYPPFCSFQYRFSVADGLGGFGSTSKYESANLGMARYFRAGYSAIALQGQISRTGGTIPESFVTCSGGRAYPKSFCGTDAELIQAEYRLDDTLPQNVKFILFFDDAASRIRSEIFPQPTSQFLWHDDVGFGIAYRTLIRVDFAFGKQGGRITFALQGQTF